MSLASINERAQKELGKRNPTAAFDPAMFAVIFEIIMQLITQLQENCGNDPEEAAEKARRPGFWGKRVVAIRSRKALGRQGWRKHGSDVTASVLKAGKGVTTQEMKDAYEDLDAR